MIAGDGNGNMNAATVERATLAAKKGILIVRSSRVPTGKVGRNVEIDDDHLRFIASDELNPAKARILLMLALLNDRSRGGNSASFLCLLTGCRQRQRQQSDRHSHSDLA